LVENLLNIGASVGTPLALAGLVVTVLYLIYRAILKGKFSRILPEHTYMLLDRMARYAFYLALTSIVLGVSAYLAVRLYGKASGVSTDALKLQGEASQHLEQG